MKNTLMVGHLAHTYTGTHTHVSSSCRLPSLHMGTNRHKYAHLKFPLCATVRTRTSPAAPPNTRVPTVPHVPQSAHAHFMIENLMLFLTLLFNIIFVFGHGALESAVLMRTVMHLLGLSAPLTPASAPLRSAL